MKTKPQIDHLLDFLCNNNRTWMWRIQGVYSDGISHYISQIHFYDLDQRRQLGFIAYNEKNGFVYHCSFMDKQGRENIIDLILDIANKTDFQA